MIVPTANIPFYWSKRRRELFRRCKRWYFLYCYGAWGGNDVSAAPEIREIHRLKRLQSTAEYLNGLTVRILREHFYRRPESSLLPFGMGRLRWELENMRSRPLKEDHNFPLLRKFVETPAELGHLAQTLQKELSCRLNTLESGFYGELCKLAFPDRVELDFPLRTFVGELPCYTPAFLIFRKAGKLCFADLNDSPEGALLHRYCAMARAGLPPEGVASFQADFDQGILRSTDTALNISELLRGIRKDVGEMSVFIPANDTADSNDFPAEPGGHCTDCPFCKWCSKNQEN